MPALAQRTVFQTLGDNLLIDTRTVRIVTDLLVSGHLEQARPPLTVVPAQLIVGNKFNLLEGVSAVCRLLPRFD